MICNKIKWHTIHVGIELFASPYERQHLFFCLRISSLGVCQTTTCIVDDSWSILLLLGQYRSQSNWAGIGSYLGWGILSKYPKVSTQANRSFSPWKAFFCSPPNTKGVPDFVRRRKGSKTVARSGIKRPQQFTSPRKLRVSDTVRGSRASSTALTFSSVQLIPFPDNTMIKNVSLSMLNWHFSSLRVHPRSFNLTMTFSNRKSCSFSSLPCTMMSSEMFSCPAIPPSAVWISYWYCFEAELTPNNSLLYLNRS